MAAQFCLFQLVQVQAPIGQNDWNTCVDVQDFYIWVNYLNYFSLKLKMEYVFLMINQLMIDQYKQFASPVAVTELSDTDSKRQISQYFTFIVSKCTREKNISNNR